MTTLERMRAAAHGPRRTKPQLVSLFCQRCERPFKSLFLDRDCFLCNKAALKAFGTPHPPFEMSG